MSKRKKRSKAREQELPAGLKQLRRLFQGIRRVAMSAVLVVGVFLGLWYAVWQAAGRQVLSSEEYFLSWQNVEITPPPPWIRRDIREEVFRDASLDGPLSILDADLTSRVANAFSLHPWVARVCRATKHHPARVRVDLVYRQPVCMVQVMGNLLPVDAEGVLLPKEDFSPIQAHQYPRLEGAETVPIGLVGSYWGDARVLGAAEIAAALGPAWKELGLKTIVPSPLVAIGHGEEYDYELVTRGGTRIRWGRPPGGERPGELPAAQKVARLIKYHQENGSLRGWEGALEADLRAQSPNRALTAPPTHVPTPPIEVGSLASGRPDRAAVDP